MESMAYSVPGLLFPAISLLMLAYTNRFLGLATVVRELIDRHREQPDAALRRQCESLGHRIGLIRHAQGLGGLSLLLCTGSLVALFWQWQMGAHWLFGGSLLLMIASLSVALSEIYLSAEAIRIELASLAERSS